MARMAEAPLILYDATHGFDDPTRRQFAAAAQEAGVALVPRVEVEHIETALAARQPRMGDTIAARFRRPHRADPRQHPRRSGCTEPIHDSFALVTRRGVALVAGDADARQPRRRLGGDGGGRA